MIESYWNTLQYHIYYYLMFSAKETQFYTLLCSNLKKAMTTHVNSTWKNHQMVLYIIAESHLKEAKRIGSCFSAVKTSNGGFPIKMHSTTISTTQSRNQYEWVIARFILQVFIYKNIMCIRSRDNWIYMLKIKYSVTPFNVLNFISRQTYDNTLAQQHSGR